MKLSDFVIGEDFLTAIGPWRCTDIGTRTITAVRWPDSRQAPREYAQRDLWLAGPPYVLPEVVFDEKEMALAYRSQEEAIARAMEEQGRASEDVAQAMGTTLQLTERNASATLQLASSIQETGRTIEDLAGLAVDLRQRTARFRL